MKNVDDHIREALQAEEHEFFDEEEDWQTHFDSLKVLFRGRTKWITIFHCAVMGFFCTMFVICAIQFFRAESIRAMIAWATGFAVFIILQGLAELYFVMEWNKYVIRWELKRLELRVASFGTLQETQNDPR